MKTSFTKISYLFFLIVAIIVVSSCRGPRGPMGEPGFDGNANVKTIQFTVHPNAWQGDVNGYNASLTVPEITQDIYNNGAVLIYRLNEDQQPFFFNAIPYTWVDGTQTEYLDANIYIGSIVFTLRWTDEDASGTFNSTQAPTGDYIFKVVIVEGVNVSDIPENVRLNYDVAKSYFHVK